MWGGSRKRRGVIRHKKMRGGMYSIEFDPSIGTGAAGFKFVPNDAIDGAGNPIQEPIMPKVGGRRRRTGKKGTRKGKKSRRVTRRRRTMRGGAEWQSISGTRAEWMGDGSAGLPTFVAGNSNIGTSGHVQNPDGGYRV